MSKKFNLKSFTMGVIVTVLVLSFFLTTGLAASFTEKIEVIYSGIKVNVDGKPVAFPKDSNGNKVEPFIYNGTTYLPVRGVAEALGEKVNWNGATQTVDIGEIDGEKLYLTEELKPYMKSSLTQYNLNDPEHLSIAGREYKTGYKLANSTYIIGKIQLNLDGLYKNLNFDLGPTSNYSDDVVVSIYLDNKLYNTYKIESTDNIQNIDIDVTGVTQLRIETDALKYRGIGIGDPVLKK